ncbi:MAG: hypothetical protein LBC67_03640 [Spirochaetales bacterium]|jgi:hypothetical protein|nr:hypothetical protein [Spirochaetales bacterium]
MTKNSNRLLLTYLGVYLAALLVIAVYSFLAAPPIRIGALRVDWILGNTLVVFTRELAPVHLSAVIFSFSLFFTLEGSLFKASFLRKIRFFIVTLFIQLFLYAALLEGGLPLALRMRDGAAEKVALSDDLRTKAQGAAVRGQYGDARRYYQYALSVFPEDGELKREMDNAEKASLFSKPSASAPKTQEEERFLEMSFDEFYRRARNAFDREDYISAEYYANLALRMNLSHPGLKRLAAESREKISQMRLTKEARAEMDFFRRKEQGVEIMQEGEPIAAYRYFLALSAERPEDTDIRHYLKLSYEELTRASFLLSEIPLTALSLAAGSSLGGDILFVNRETADFREFIHIRRIIQADAYYALDVEGLGMAEDGSVAYQFSAPYGKFIEDELLMRCFTDDGKEEVAPIYFTGESPDVSRYQIPLEASPETLSLLSEDNAGLDTIPLPSLLSLASAAPFLGVSHHSVYMVFFSRILLPFSFFILSFFAAAYGLRYKSRYPAAPPLPYFFFLPLLPFVVIILYHTYLYGLFSFQDTLLGFLGFSGALPAFFLTQGLLLFFALLALAKQLRD